MAYLNLDSNRLASLFLWPLVFRERMLLLDGRPKDILIYVEKLARPRKICGIRKSLFIKKTSKFQSISFQLKDDR